jgi:hypothetical protein
LSKGVVDEVTPCEITLVAGRRSEKPLESDDGSLYNPADLLVGS